MVPNKCEACGGDLVYRIKGSTQGYYCTKCDWSVVATYFPPIIEDESIYFVRVLNGDFANYEHIKSVSSVMNINFLEARNLLKQENPLVFEGSATRVAEVREELKRAGLDVKIEPDFPY